MSPEEKIAARRQLAIDVSGIALRAIREKLPALEEAMRTNKSARLSFSFTLERWTPPANKREPNPTSRLRATIRVGKQNAILELTSDQAALFAVG